MQKILKAGLSVLKDDKIIELLILLSQVLIVEYKYVSMFNIDLRNWYR